MISFFFGLPRSGKTTILASFAYKESKKIQRGKSKYKYILSNVELNIPGVHLIQFDDIGIYEFTDSLILIDEASVFCDNRDWKNFSKHKIAFMMLHGHYNCDFCFFSQSYNGYDSKLRSITSNVYYVRRGLFFSKYTRIPYGIIIPDRKDNAGSRFGEIIEGYCKPSFFIRLFSPRVLRCRYFKYFNSFSRPLKLKTWSVPDPEPDPVREHPASSPQDKEQSTVSTGDSTDCTGKAE